MCVRVRVLLPLLILIGCLMSPADGEVPRHVHQRSQFTNARIRFEREQAGHVAFIGGSITEMNGYRPLICEYLQRRFPETKFAFTAAGVSSTCSTTGAFRLEHDLLSKGQVDLLFVEFAVNDDQDAGHAARECRRGMEGILRHARQSHPEMEIVVTYFVNEGMLALLQEGQEPISISAHEAVARHYGVTTSHHAQEIADQITAGNLTWQDYGGVHPAPRGNAIAARLVIDLLDTCWEQPLALDASAVPYPMPDLLDSKAYVRGRFLDAGLAQCDGDWRLEVPQWQSIKGSFRSTFADLPLLCADQPGSELSFSFEGTAAGAYVLAGPDAGQLQYSIDGSEFKSVELFHRFSKGLHYPRTVLFDADLSDGPHDVVLRVSPEHAGDSTGTSVRILHLVAN